MGLEQRYPRILFPGFGRGGQKCLATGGAAVVGFSLPDQTPQIRASQNPELLIYCSP